MQDLPLEPGMLQAENKVEVWLKNAVVNEKLGLGFASVVLEEVK